MRKLIVILFFLPLILCAQVRTHTDAWGASYGWKLSNEPVLGTGAFWYKIERSTYTDYYGYYTYNVWFQSNSYDAYGYKRNTYITGITVISKYKTGNYNQFTPFWVLCAWKPVLGATFRSTVHNEVLRVKWKYAMVY